MKIVKEMVKKKNKLIFKRIIFFQENHVLIRFKVKFKMHFVLLKQESKIGIYLIFKYENFQTVALNAYKVNA